MNLPYASTQDLVTELRTKHFPRLYVLPYNRFDIDHSQHWWLSPTSEKQAFKYGKIGCTTSEHWVPPGQVFCGFELEKGFGAEADFDPSVTMSKEWFWHRFVDLAGQPLTDKVTEACDAVSDRLQMRIGCGLPAPDAREDRAWFEMDGSTLTQLSWEIGDGLLSDVAAATTMDNFAAALREFNLKKPDWYWVHVSIGHPFNTNTSGPDDLDQCAAMLKPFDRWMRATV